MMIALLLCALGAGAADKVAAQAHPTHAASTNARSDGADRREHDSPGSGEASIETEKLMLTGHGPEDAVRWDFTIDGGMRANEKTTIAVPSNWQQQGFGHYQYGVDRARRTHDRGVYHRTVDVPAAWRGKAIRIVFDAVMTDALVKVNGVEAGPLHQGGFNRFSYDITPLVRFGAANDVTVEVSESSADAAVDKAERAGDFWTFGGIYRPAWLEARPVEAIAHVAIDAQASGAIAAEVALSDTRTVTSLVAQVVDRDGRAVGSPFMTPLPAGGTGLVTMRGAVQAPLLWSAEAPNLYFLDITLMKGKEAVHRVRTRFGFRTFEVRDGDGLYLNGRRILLKGVDRHSFRPETGRSLSRADSYADAKLIRSMNMNAVRSSHYAPEENFLEAADELGLYVIDELTSWHFHYPTEQGRGLVRELIERDVNHPSILFWANGNEGGFNRELDPEFARFDAQRRRVLHPYNSTAKPEDESLRPGRAEAIRIFEPYDGIDAKHYPTYQEYVRRLAGSVIFMPTEFLHGLYDGGQGSGLADYWAAMTASRIGGGGFLWSFADEGLARTDQGGKLDYAASLAPDGIVGAHHEPEPSYFTVRDIWSPVQIDAPTIDASFDGRLKVANSYDFTSLSLLDFQWEWLRFRGPADTRVDAIPLAAGTVSGPAIAPHGEGVLVLPLARRPLAADALRLTARRDGETVMQWVWPVAEARPERSRSGAGPAPRVVRTGASVELVAGDAVASFDPGTGMLRSLARGRLRATIGGGPRLVFARPTTTDPVWTAAAARPGNVFVPPRPGVANVVEVDVGLTREEGWSGFTLQISPDGKAWRTVFSGMRTPGEPPAYTFPAQQVAAIRLLDMFFLRGEPRVRSVRLGYQADRFNPATLPAASLSFGSGADPATGKAMAWLEAPGAGGLERVRWSMDADGRLTLDYRYRLTGPTLYHGIGFGVPESGISATQALLRGPWPVWQNRMRGPQLGVYEIARAGMPGALAPDRAGYFADPRWVKLDLEGAGLLIRPSPGTPFLQLGARLNDHANTSPPFPDTAFGFMQAIPAMGSKVVEAAESGPQSEPAVAKGMYEGRLSLELLPR